MGGRLEVSSIGFEMKAIRTAKLVSILCCHKRAAKEGRINEAWIKNIRYLDRYTKPLPYLNNNTALMLKLFTVRPLSFGLEPGLGIHRFRHHLFELINVSLVSHFFHPYHHVI